jgi:lactoylglutathione lyase
MAILLRGGAVPSSSSGGNAMTTFDGLMFWVADVPATVAFYEEAFGLRRRWLRDEGDYAQMDTGAVVLQFAVESAAPTSGLKIRPHRADEDAAAVQLGLTADDVPAAYRRAVAAGATAVAEPVTKPWGQIVAYVRDPDGILVELTSPGD